MSKLAIKRPSEWINVIRNYSVYLDGKKVGVIENDDIQVFDIEPGHHELKIKIDWCGSQKVTFDINDDGIKMFKVTSFKYSNWLLPVFFIMMLYYAFDDSLGLTTKHFVILISPIFIYLFYHLSFGKDKYLRLDNMNMPEKNLID